MLSELARCFHPRRQGLDVFDLHFGDALEDVARPLLDERHEGSVAEWSVWTAEGEGVGEGRDPDAEVRCHAVGTAPERAQVGAVCDEGEARKPGGVEAGCADDHIDVVSSAFVVDEACFGDAADGVGECGCVGGDEGFEVAWCWGWATAAGVEVFWDHLLAEAWVVIEFLPHLLIGVLARNTSLVTAFHDELEALVEFVFDLFAVLEVLLWVVLKEFELFVAV